MPILKVKGAPETPPRRSPLQPRKARDPEALPDAPEIEMAVLAGILSDPDHAFSAFERIGRKSFFFNPVNRELYDRAKAFYSENGRIDLIGFTQHLGDIGRLQSLGGPANVTEIFVNQRAQLSEDWLAYYVDELRDRYIRRQIMTRSFALAGKAKTDDVNELLSELAHNAIDLQLANTGHNTLADATLYLNGNCPPLPAEIVYHLLHQGSKMIVGGTSKGRKTMALIDLAVSVATGAKWWGFGTKRGAICYINFEIQDPFFWYRVNQVCHKKDVQIPEGVFYAWNLRGRAEGIERLMEEILTELKRKPFVLIIIDPIYKALGDRDENRAGDVASMLNEIEKIAVQTNAAVAFGAHYSKGNQSMKESVDRIGGSGVFARDPDTILTMTAHEQEECFTVEGTLRNFPPMRPFVVKWDWPLFIREDEADPNRLKKSRKDAGKFETKYPNSLLLDQLSVIHGAVPKDVVKYLTDLHGMTRRTIYRMKEELEQKGVLIVRDNQWFRAMKGQCDTATGDMV